MGRFTRSFGSLIRLLISVLSLANVLCDVLKLDAGTADSSGLTLKPTYGPASSYVTFQSARGNRMN